MTSRITTMEPPPLLGLPPEEPVPPADCEPCARLVELRAAARAKDDGSRVSDMNVLIRRHHPQPRRKRRR
ncbi:hypothetical protein [Streptomyces ipomoeae]|uniref:hypothetical protein n=1 Tax=Streptomyces ipomoeae TaxID=103232 RepID=UPI001FD3095C|nr:hypothetical protein [Streptomyces ipomoeae]MDX2692972.1 hypothetical protein [Streptomyces ipomoeae]MDX2840704.1 hypothetical protein [Streptomyces ipomoeae]MDX2939043.1 hypothetical protein [Streptomyces ipomoeae]